MILTEWWGKIVFCLHEKIKQVDLSAQADSAAAQSTENREGPRIDTHFKQLHSGSRMAAL